MSRRPQSTDPSHVLLARLRCLLDLERQLTEELAATQMAVDWLLEDLEAPD